MDVRGNEEKALEKQTAYEKEKQIHDICIHDFQPDSTLVQAEISPFVGHCTQDSAFGGRCCHAPQS